MEKKKYLIKIGQWVETYEVQEMLVEAKDEVEAKEDFFRRNISELDNNSDNLTDEERLHIKLKPEIDSTIKDYYEITSQEQTTILKYDVPSFKIIEEDVDA